MVSKERLLVYLHLFTGRGRCPVEQKDPRGGLTLGHLASRSPFLQVADMLSITPGH